MPRKKGELHPDAIAFIVYVEVAQNWAYYKNRLEVYNQKKNRIIQIFEEHCFKGFISPLHEPEGDAEKYHFHVMLIFPPRRGLSISSYRDFVNVCDGANGHVEILYAPHEYARYLIHNGEKYKDKKQYNKEDVSEIGLSYIEYSSIYDFEADILEDNTSILINIIKWLDAYQVIFYSDLVNYAILNKIEWLPVIKSNVQFLKEYMRSNEYVRRIQEKHISRKIT